MASCFKVCLDCVQGPSVFSNHVRLRENAGVALDPDRCGTNVILLKDGRRICGSGAAIANAPLVQNKAYFEAKIQQTGRWGVGVALHDADPDVIPLGNDSNSCVLRNSGQVFFGGRLLDSFGHEIEEGSVVGVSFDHIELRFSVNVNGTTESIAVAAMKSGLIFPVVYVHDNAIVDLYFTSFSCRMPDGFEEIMLEQTLL